MEFIEKPKNNEVLEFWRFDPKKVDFDCAGAICKPPINHHFRQMYFKPADKAPLNRIAISYPNSLNCTDKIKKTAKPPKTP